MKYLINLIRPNTAAVLSRFTKTLNKLEAIAHRELNSADKATVYVSKEVERHAAKLNQLHDKRRKHTQEAVIAQRAHTKIKQAFGL